MRKKYKKLWFLKGDDLKSWTCRFADVSVGKVQNNPDASDRSVLH